MEYSDQARRMRDQILGDPEVEELLGGLENHHVESYDTVKE